MASTTFPFYLFKEGANPVAWKTCLYFLRGPTKFLLWGLTRNAVSPFCMVQMKLATANTCDLQLRLPTCHQEDFASFKEALIMSLEDSDGFGGV